MIHFELVGKQPREQALCQTSCMATAMAVPVRSAVLLLHVLRIVSVTSGACDAPPCSTLRDNLGALISDLVSGAGFWIHLRFCLVLHTPFCAVAHPHKGCSSPRALLNIPHQPHTIVELGACTV
jgi:hypothetical protein